MILIKQTSGGSAPATDPTPGVNQKKKEKKKDKLKEKKKEKESAQSFNNSGSEKAQPKQIPESKQSKQPKQPKFEHPVSDTKPQEEPLLKHPKAKKPKKSKENKNIASEPTLEKEQKAEAVDEHADLVQSTNAILNGMCAALIRSFQILSHPVQISRNIWLPSA